MPLALDGPRDKRSRGEQKKLESTSYRLEIITPVNPDLSIYREALSILHENMR